MLDAHATTASRRAVLAFGAAGTAGGAAAQTPSAAAWPDRPVRVINPVGPGSDIDLIARVLAEGLAARFGQPFPVENRPGAESVLAAEAHAAARPGDTLLVAAAGIVGTVPLLHEGRLPYDPRDLVPVATLSTGVLCFAAPATLPETTLAALLARARASPGALNWSSIAGLNQLTFRMLLRERGLDMAYVAYRTTPAAVLDLAAGRIQMAIVPLAVMLGPLREGRVRALAVAAGGRAPFLPDVPTVREAGFAELEADAVLGLFGWRGMPDAVRDRLAAAAMAAMAEPAAQERLRSAGVLLRPGGPAAFADAIATSKARAEAAVRVLGPRPPG
ncbi:MAG: tripartite tricarboxylate transporter substrate binding protein [Acetobacteraceae bacterium]|nr:tripartite tricarboxylate transporter substrate binding protein [Acetobacteraceae bacterium]